MYSSYLITFLLLSFSTNTYAADTKADADCKNNFVFLEIKYSALLEEYNGYRDQAIKFLPNIGKQCFKSYNPVKRKKYNEIIHADDCVELDHLITDLDSSMYLAAYKAYHACIYKNRYVNAACVNCDKTVKQETNYTGRDSAYIKSLFNGKLAENLCNRDSSRYRHPCKLYSGTQ